MELFTSIFLGIVAIGLGVALIIYAFRGRQSETRRLSKFRERP